jgi:hypothetical protein
VGRNVVVGGGDGEYSTPLITEVTVGRGEAGLAERVRLSSDRILLLGDVPRIGLERQAIKAVDWLVNRWVSKHIPVPFSYLDDGPWKALFRWFDLVVEAQSKVFPLPFPRLNHPLYVLRKA